MERAERLARELRHADVFHESQASAPIMAGFFPESTAELALDLSNVTSMFYGLALQVTREREGDAAMDALSRAIFYRLGRAKSRATRDAEATRGLFHGDARDLVTILISAIYNASPEYTFRVSRHAADLCAVELSGVDRYYRAATRLGIADGLTWPTLHPFFEGVSDELGLDCAVRSRATRLQTEQGEIMHARYVFERRARRSAAA